PVNFGEVCFETPQNTFIGRLDDTGHYTVSNTEDGNGIPPGDYTVYLSGTSLVSTGKPAKTAARDKGNTELVAMTETVRVHPKYTQPGTDALKFAVKKDGEKHFDFTVERPPQKRR
ncbi:MAG: hypothetical protein LBN39_04505, partial [Planctomycetaceae bacterium]|nr:hypothetical protein [Planctomycetaceae bacterium]